MIGQSFSPLTDDRTQQRPGGGPSGPSGQGPQEAIRVLNLRLPRVFGGGSPAPSALLTSPGSAGLPQQNINPMIQAILQAVLGRFQPQAQHAPSAPGGGLTPTPGVPGGYDAPPMQVPLPNPAFHYQQPPVGGPPAPPPSQQPFGPEPGRAPGRFSGGGFGR